MDDLISRSALLDQLSKYFFLHDGNDFMDVMRKVANAPAVDTVAVVRCKDCKWRNTKGCIYVRTLAASREDDDYCSDGERREENAAD